MAKNNSELKGVQKKLVAAIAMVLVACIMVVSSSYAWFTLSTAPEVKGIQTSVGSNGNLEMALITTDDPDSITTGTGKTGIEANEYWGNLVDLGFSEYAMDKIALAPARLNLLANNAVSDTYLYTPIYGTDGRVSDFETVAQSGKPRGEQFIADEAHYGVRAIGVASGLSAGALALRNARSEVNSAKDTVTRLVRTSLEVDAINLANLMIANQITSKSVVTSGEWDQVTDAVDRLGSIATQLKTAMDKVVIAVAVSQGKTITANDITYSNSGVTVDGVTVDAALNVSLGKAYATLTSINGKVGRATAIINANPDNTSYDIVEDVMAEILTTNNLTIRDVENNTDVTLNGQTPDALLPIVVYAFMYNEGKLPMTVVSGIYAEIAEFIGQYSASSKITVNLEDTSYEDTIPGMNVVSITAQIKVPTAAPAVNDDDPPVTSYYFEYFVAQLSSLSASDAGSGNTDEVLSDLYAYAIDLAFRTNAANSSLMLQTTPASRVGQDTTAAIQGAGSYMQFVIGDDENYSLDQMRDLMSAIRVVLMDFETQEVYAIAALDMNVAEEVTVDGKEGIKASLYLYNYTVDGQGVMTLGEKIVTPETDGTKTAITELVQNQVLGLTAMVYLDGDQVDNSDVATFGKSMTGTINLQFASSAPLDPMDYTFSEQATTTPAPTVDDALAATGIAWNGKTLSFTAAADTTNHAVKIGNGEITPITGVPADGIDLTAMLGDQEVQVTIYSYNTTANTYATATTTYTPPVTP